MKSPKKIWVLEIQEQHFITYTYVSWITINFDALVVFNLICEI